MELRCAAPSHAPWYPWHLFTLAYPLLYTYCGS
jgi:hypothetical protein